MFVLICGENEGSYYHITMSYCVFDTNIEKTDVAVFRPKDFI